MPERICCCCHPDARECARLRDGRPPRDPEDWLADRDDECNCGCHLRDTDEDDDA